MNEYTVKDYESFVNAVSILNKYKDNQLFIYGRILECKQIIDDPSVIDGPIAEEMKNAFEVILSDGDVIDNIFDSNIYVLVDIISKYQTADIEAHNVITNRAGLSNYWINNNSEISAKVINNDFKNDNIDTIVNAKVVNQEAIPDVKAQSDNISHINEKKINTSGFISSTIVNVNHLDDSSNLNNNNTKNMDELVKEVIHGDWGNDEERYNRLTAAGYNYDEVQDLVNKKLS